MIHFTLFAYIFTVSMLMLSFGMLIHYRKSLKKQNLFLYRLIFFLVVFLFITIMNMCSYYETRVVGILEKQLFTEFCDMICNFSIYFWIKTQSQVCKNKLSRLTESINEGYIICYVTVWLIAISPFAKEYSFIKYFDSFVIIILLMSVSGCLWTWFTSQNRDRSYVIYSLCMNVGFFYDYFVYLAEPYSSIVSQYTTAWVWLIISVMTFVFVVMKKDDYILEAVKTEENIELTYIKIKEQYQLTNREYDILKEVLKGSNNMEISNTLFISENTVKTHIHNLIGKMECKSRNGIIEIVKKMEKDAPTVKEGTSCE